MSAFMARRHVQKYVDSLSHSHLRAILDQRVTDGVIRRMIDKWLNAGVLEAGNLHFATEGTPQGGELSPIFGDDLIGQAAVVVG